MLYKASEVHGDWQVMKHTMLNQWAISPANDRQRFEARMGQLYGCVYHDGRCLLHDTTLLLELSEQDKASYRAHAVRPKYRDQVKWKHKNY